VCIVAARLQQVGGAGPQQAISGLPFVRDRAFTPTAARRLHDFLVDAPYRRLDVARAVALHQAAQAAKRHRRDGAPGPHQPQISQHDNESSQLDDETSQLDDEEVRCLAALDEALLALRGRGEVIAGVLVEFVRAHDGLALSPAYAHALAAWAAGHRLLLFDDSVPLLLPPAHLRTPASAPHACIRNQTPASPHLSAR
jgi:hypothetical protein